MTALVAKQSEFASVIQRLDHLKITTFERILKLTTSVAELTTLIGANKSSTSAEKLVEITKEMNDFEREEDRKHTATETVLKVVRHIKDLTKIITREFKSKDIEKLAQVKRITEDLAQDLKCQNPGDEVQEKIMLKAASCTSTLAQIMMKVNQDKWYQEHMTTATRINSCKSTDYARILDLEEFNGDTKANKADKADKADKAFNALSNLFDPHAMIGKQYYEGAWSAADRKFNHAIFHSCSLNILI